MGVWVWISRSIGVYKITSPWSIPTGSVHKSTGDRVLYLSDMGVAQDLPLLWATLPVNLQAHMDGLPKNDQSGGLPLVLTRFAPLVLDDTVQALLGCVILDREWRPQQYIQVILNIPIHFQVETPQTPNLINVPFHH